MNKPPILASIPLRTTAMLMALSWGILGSASAQNVLDPTKASAAELTTAFTEADKDGDKSLSAFESRRLPVVSKDFAKHDKNGDSYLSLEEFMAAMKTAKTARK